MKKKKGREGKRAENRDGRIIMPNEIDRDCELLVITDGSQYRFLFLGAILRFFHNRRRE